VHLRGKSVLQNDLASAGANVSGNSKNFVDMANVVRLCELAVSGGRSRSENDEPIHKLCKKRQIA